MLSKEDKLKYGEMLRLQMKEKQQKKKLEQIQKRGGIKKSSTDGNLLIQKQNNTVDKKQQLQRKFQTQDYGPFGRPGGGAPSKNYQQEPTYIKQPNQPIYRNQTQQESIQDSRGIPQMHKKIYTQQGYQNPQNQQKIPMNILPTQPAYDSYPSYSPQIYGGYQPSQYNQQMHQYSQQPPQYNQQPSQYTQQQYKQQGDYQQYPQNYQKNRGHQEYLPQPNYQKQNNDTYIDPRYQQNQVIQQQQRLQYPQNQQSQQMYQRVYQDQNTQRQQKQKTVQNEELMQVYKKGGRNLLKLENETRQKQKLEMQKYLKLQMEEAQRKKRQEKQKLKQQQLQEEKRNLEYLNRQKQKILDDQRKQQEKRQKIQQENQRNLKLKKQMQQDAKKAAQLKNKKTVIPQPEQKNNNSRQIKNKLIQQSQSESSSSVIIEQAFNTDVSREFFKKQRQPQKYQQQNKKMEIFTDQLQKMRDQISHQGQMFQKQIMKVKMEAQRAMHQKKKADEQINKLKYELKKKMQQDNEKLYQALNRNSKENYDQPPRQNYQNKRVYGLDRNQQKIPLKPKKQQKLISKNYQVPQLINNQFNDPSKSLVGDSKKIPININTNDQLTMSRLEDYARQTSFFKKKQNNSNTNNDNFGKRKSRQYIDSVKNSIVQEDQERLHTKQQSRINNKNISNQPDQLDRLIQSREKSRGGWGQLSSVNSDITKQIQDLLKKKGNQRPNSHLSNVGRNMLGNQGIAYEGISLNSINSGNTLDIDKIQNRNDNRLRQLKNLGVETVNTNNGDDDLDRLDALLKKYN